MTDMKIYRFALSIICMILLAACSAGDSFKIEGLVEGQPNVELRVVYTDDNGNFVQTVLMSDEKGRFSMSGNAFEKGIVEIYSRDNGLVALLVAENGDKIQVKIRPATREVEARGNKGSEQIAEWLTANKEAIAAHDYDAVNKAVLKFTGDNPDSEAGPALLLTMFSTRGNETLADSIATRFVERELLSTQMNTYLDQLRNQVSAAAETRLRSMKFRNLKDSLVNWDAYKARVSLLAFERHPHEILRDTLMSLHRDINRKRLELIEVSLTADSAAWKRMFEGDSARWARVWTPGMAGAPAWEQIRPPYTPFYVVADSTGKVLYRGADIVAAARVTRSAAR